MHPELAGYPVIVVCDVAWGDMDSFAHVNNVVYFRYFENARLEYFRQLDWFALEEETGVVAAVVGCRGVVVEEAIHPRG